MISLNLVLAVNLPSQHVRKDNPAARTRLPEGFVEEVQARIDAKWYPTLVVAFVHKHGSKILSFGKLDNGKAPDGHTVYEIGSITKTFTAALLAQNILSGRIKPDSAVLDLLPGFPSLSRNGKQITPANLATQFSGLPYMPDNLASADPANPYAGYDAAKLKAFLAAYQLKRAPDETYEYSNLGFGLLGFALAQPLPYESVLRTNILQPLGMKITGARLDDAMKAHLAPGHDRHNQAAKNWTFDALAGCGAIDSTAEDMLRYLKANMPGAKTLLSPAFHLAQQARRTVNNTEQIGFAWMTRKTNTGDIIWHNGTTFGYASFIGFAADGKRGIVILTNVGESVDDLGFAALSASPLHSIKTIPLDNSTLNSYEGIYQESGSASGHGLIKVFTKDGQAFAQAQGEEPLPLFAQSRDEFFTRIDGFHIIYHRTADGAVDSLILRQNQDRICAETAWKRGGIGALVIPNRR